MKPPHWSSSFFQLQILVLAIFVPQGNCQLELIKLNTRIPLSYAVTDITALYDGGSCIYLLKEYSIYRFNVVTETITRVEQSPQAPNFGSAIMKENGQTYYFGGSHNLILPTKIYETQLTPYSVSISWTARTTIGRLEHNSGIYNRNDDSAYIFGGLTDRVPGPVVTNVILKYSISSNITTIAARLPTPTYVASIAWDFISQNAYLVGGQTGSISLDKIVKFDSKSCNVSVLEAKLPRTRYYSCSVWARDKGFVIGGTPDGRVVSFSPLESNVTVHQVNNYPVDLFRAGCVFVDTLNRIYIFGGFSQETVGNEIMYIDLNR